VLGEFKKYRKHNKVYSLPDAIREELDNMLMDTSITYQTIAEWVEEQGYEISKSTIGRYAFETKKLANRLIETQAQVRELVKLAKQTKDDEGMTEGALQFASSKLTEKIAMIEDELDEMDPGEAIDLMIKLSRAKAYKDNIYAGLKGKYDKAFETFKQTVYQELESNYPDVAERLVEIANNTLGKVMSNPK
jgi:hypothetical protein